MSPSFPIKSLLSLIFLFAFSCSSQAEEYFFMPCNGCVGEVAEQLQQQNIDNIPDGLEDKVLTQIDLQERNYISYQAHESQGSNTHIIEVALPEHLSEQIDQLLSSLDNLTVEIAQLQIPEDIIANAAAFSQCDTCVADIENHIRHLPASIDRVEIIAQSMDALEIPVIQLPNSTNGLSLVDGGEVNLLLGIAYDFVNQDGYQLLIGVDAVFDKDGNRVDF